MLLPGTRTFGACHWISIKDLNLVDTQRWCCMSLFLQLCQKGGYWFARTSLVRVLAPLLSMFHICVIPIRFCWSPSSRLAPLLQRINLLFYLLSGIDWQTVPPLFWLPLSACSPCVASPCNRIDAISWASIHAALRAALAVVRVCTYKRTDTFLRTCTHGM